MSQKPTIPRGTRDFAPKEIAQRDYIFGVLKSNFQRFGFQPIQTPCMENITTLMGKYGEEGDTLIFKILNSGDYLSKSNIQHLEDKDSKALTQTIVNKALRYDLTVPFARYVVQHQNEITFPFKRYQIQTVWRADRPQKGRFREFYQCDADVVGSHSLWQEVDFIQLYDAVFTDLKLKGVTIKLNHRKILAAIAELVGASDKLIDFMVALDKLDKIGIERVTKKMLSKGISQQAVEKLRPLFILEGEGLEKLNTLEDLLKFTKSAKKGCDDLRFILEKIELLGLKNTKIDLDITLARGLHYYTGAIFEVVAPRGIAVGSIGGGGRYDDLTGIFGLKNISGVGISFGLDRMYLILEQLNLLQSISQNNSQVMFVNFGEKEAMYCMRHLKTLREKKIRCELYPDAAKLKKQFQYADKKNITYVVMIGSQEMETGIFTLKNMKTGEQKTCNETQLLQILKF